MKGKVSDATTERQHYADLLSVKKVLDATMKKLEAQRAAH